MTFDDWVEQTKTRFRHKPLPNAAFSSILELCLGLQRRLARSTDTVILKLGRNCTTTLAGVSVSWVVDSHKQIRRARDARNEKDVLEWLLEDIEGDTLWDVGSHHGTYAIPAAVKGADVIAFEPVESSFERLQENAAENDLKTRFEARRFALSDSDGVSAIVTEDQPPESQLDPESDGPNMVKHARGDDLSPKPDRVKIDVEGHEVAVLDGMEETLSTVDRIIVETHDPENAGAVESRLREAGLDIIRFDQDRDEVHVGGIRSE